MKRVAQYVLYATIPVAIVLQFMHASLVWEFVFACAAVLPLAAWIGVSTEQLAHRMGTTYGALFNATFGNLAELIIAVFAIRAGLPDVVRASFAGSIVGNLLFVGGLSMVAGRWKRQTIKFNALSAESQAGQLILALGALIVPAVFFRSAIRAHHPELIHQVSIGTSIILLISYALGLYFAFKTHRNILGAVTEAPPPTQQWSMRNAIMLLVIASGLMGVVAEGLVDVAGGAGRVGGM